MYIEICCKSIENSSFSKIHKQHEKLDIVYIFNLINSVHVP